MSVQSTDRREYMSHIVVLTGPPLSGKTTLGREISRLTNHIHLDIDEQGLVLKEVLGNPPRNWFENSMGMMVKYSLLHERAARRLISDEPVVLTATYSHKTYEDALRWVLADTYSRFAKLQEPPLRIFELDSPVASLAERIAARQNEGSFSNVDSLKHASELREKFVHMSGDDIVRVDTGLPIEQNIAQILEALEPFRKAA